MRWALLLCAALLNGLLASAWRSPAERAVVYPLAPPLTRIAAMGERALDPTGTPPPPAAEPLRALAPLLRSSATPSQRALLQRAQSIEGEVAPMLSRSQALRYAVEVDAVALTEILGPTRVARFIAQKEAMSAAVGETRVWTTLAADLRASTP